MNSVITEFNKGFGNCIFISRDPQSVVKTIMDKADKAFSVTLTAVKVVPVDELHDKLSLSLDDGSNVEGVISWHKTTTGAHYVLTELS